MQKQAKLPGFARARLSLEVAQNCIAEAYEIEKKAGEDLLLAEEYKKKAKKYLDAKGLKHLDTQLSDITIRLQTYSRTTINYFIDKLKQGLSKEVLNEVIDRKYVIQNMESFKEVMKRYKVPPNALKECLSITESVNKKRMDELFEAGYITTDQLKDCYEIKESTTLSVKEI